VNVKPLDQIASKWSQRASAAGAAYTSGVQNPSRSWATSTTAAAPNWATGVQTAVSNGRFAKGVQAAGDAKWSAGATGKGATRYPQGVTGAAAINNFTQGFTKFASVLSSLTLPPRFPKGDPQNAARSTAVATALRAAKVGS
jgi:hypothetical protein